MIIFGIGNVLVFIPIIPDMMNSIKSKHSFMHHDIVSDIASGLFNSSLALGSFLGPFGDIINFNNFSGWVFS